MIGRRWKVPIRMPANVVLVPGFKCGHEGCTARLFAHAPSAARHGQACIHNPVQRTCATCDHDADRRDGEEGCAIDARTGDVKLVRRCAAWVPRDLRD